MIRMTFSRPAAWIVALATAIASTEGRGQSARPAPPELTAADLEAWLDGYLPAALARNDMAGAVIAVVKDGKVLLIKGFGYDDVAARRPVDPERTLFPVASISKTFTATAVMQLVEQGKLDLDRDINDYLDFTIPAAFGKPITLRHLLTHTAGFDDLQKGSSPADSTWYLTLEAYMKRRSPNRIFPPGEVPAYSNYGLGLAAYLVERTSGEPFEEYLRRHVLEPLDMRRTSAYQPTPPDLIGDRVKAYLVASGPVQLTEFTNTRGAGGVAATAADMSRYMIAHLDDGRLGDVSMLRPETAGLMHTPSFHAVPEINGLALGFFQEDYNGRRIIGHDGDTKGVHSNLKLFLDERVGFFADFNSDGRSGAVYQLREAIFRDFADRYFPGPIPDEPTTATAVEHSRLMAGSYQSSRRLNGVLSVFMMFNGVEVSAHGDGTISIPMPPTGETKRYHEIGPFLWREVGGKALLGARIRDGKVASLHEDPVGALIRVPLWRSAGFNLPPLMGSILILIIAAVGVPIGVIVRPRTVPPEGRWIVWGGVVAMLVFIAGWIVLSTNLLTHFYRFNASLDPWLRALHLFGVLGIVGAVMAIVGAVRAWRRHAPWRSRLASTLLAGAMLWMVWFSVAFNLITLSLDY